MNTEERASFLERGETNMVSHRPRKRTWKRTNERCPAQPVRKERSKGWCAKELASPQTAPEVRYVVPGFFYLARGLQCFFRYWTEDHIDRSVSSFVESVAFIRHARAFRYGLVAETSCLNAVIDWHFLAATDTRSSVRDVNTKRPLWR